MKGPLVATRVQHILDHIIFSGLLLTVGKCGVVVKGILHSGNRGLVD